MSENSESEAPEVCASCGIAAVDNIKLKKCDGGCDLVKYCRDDCQTNHREQHEDECNKRKAELRDKDLFTQPDSRHLGECPICFLPLPLDPGRSAFMSCCSKLICNGCNYANHMREREGGLEHRCVYCREPAAKSKEEVDKNIMKRIKKNDPAAMTHMGTKHQQKGEYDKTLQYYTKAVELGFVEAHCCLGGLYYEGKGVEKDEKKTVYHCEQAAIGGHPHARAFLAFHEEENGRMERAAKHYIINAKLGCNDSLQSVKKLFVAGILSKEDYAASLRGHQAAVDATKSAKREAAEAYSKARNAASRGS